mmetsp:Transcript_119420/g.337893  ORF Transcript_119420/g.337893 Transcript_119420/m.337893 type:complete len:272 (+) Transcript_119420:433-1248(+)
MCADEAAHELRSGFRQYFVLVPQHLALVKRPDNQNVVSNERASDGQPDQLDLAGTRRCFRVTSLNLQELGFHDPERAFVSDAHAVAVRTLVVYQMPPRTPEVHVKTDDARRAPNETSRLVWIRGPTEKIAGDKDPRHHIGRERRRRNGAPVRVEAKTCLAREQECSHARRMPAVCCEVDLELRDVLEKESNRPVFLVLGQFSNPGWSNSFPCATRCCRRYRSRAIVVVDPHQGTVGSASFRRVASQGDHFVQPWRVLGAVEVEDREPKPLN